jgi:hypothetical protein
MLLRSLLAALVCLGLVAGAACGKYPDLATSLKVVNTLTGYYDDGPAPDGQNRLLPSVTFQLKNETTEPLSEIDLAVAYWEVGADGEKDSKQIRGIAGTPLGPGQTGEPITVRSSVGYTYPGPRAEIFTNSQFKGFIVKFFAKYRGRTTRLGELPVESRLLPAAGRDGKRP